MTTTYPLRTSPSLSMARSAAAAAAGVGFWLLAALMIRYGERRGLYDGAWRVAMFLLVVPLTWLVIAALRRGAGVAADRLGLAVIIGTVAALLCDVAALTWFPGLYAADAAHVLSGVIWILWGVAWALILSNWRGGRQTL